MSDHNGRGHVQMEFSVIESQLLGSGLNTIKKVSNQAKGCLNTIKKITMQRKFNVNS